MLEAALPVFKDLGLTQDQAQKLVDIQTARDIAFAKSRDDTYAATRTDWQTKTRADFPGAALESAKVEIGRALAVLPADLSASFREAMDITGAGDHPAVFKALHKLAAYVTEGKHVSGRGPSEYGQRAPNAAPPSAAAALYPNLPRAS